MKPKEKVKRQDTAWQEKIVQVRRVTKVVKGGKKLSFRVVLVIGNEQGTVGVGLGKAGNVIGAVQKGVTDAKKHLINMPLTKTYSIPHKIQGTAGAAKIVMRPSAPGSGVIAGGSVRTVLELVGVRNILAKQLGSNNPLNNARATINALKNLKTLSQVKQDRNISFEEGYTKKIHSHTQ